MYAKRKQESGISSPDMMEEYETRLTRSVNNFFKWLKYLQSGFSDLGQQKEH